VDEVEGRERHQPRHVHLDRGSHTRRQVAPCRRLPHGHLMRRQTVLVTAGATLGVVLLWYLFFWAPRGHGLSSAKKQALAAEAKRAELQNQLTSLRGLQQRSAITRAKLEQVRIAVPDHPALAEFILDANAAATKAGVEFLSISPQPPSVAAPAATSTIGGRIRNELSPTATTVAVG